MRSSNHHDVTPLRLTRIPTRGTPFRRALPAAMALMPISLLFGVLAYRADWNVFEVLVASLLGFTGSGQFALLPLASTGTGFLTLLMICVSINSRYLPIALTTTRRLPHGLLSRACAAHMLGDEAYATERATDRVKDVLITRSTLFFAWASAGVFGAWLGDIIPASWLSDEINPGFPASAVLVYLSMSRLRPCIGRRHTRTSLIILACTGLAGICYQTLGPVYFWAPSTLAAALVLGRCQRHD